VNPKFLIRNQLFW